MRLFIIGSGKMAEEYIKVLINLKLEFKVISRNEITLGNLFTKYNIDVSVQDVNSYNFEKNDIVINCVNINNLYTTNYLLLQQNVKILLSEKPIALTLNQLKKLKKTPSPNSLLLAFNRRFYESTINAKKIILEDGGARTCSFQFNERTLDWDPPYSTPGTIENNFPLHSQSIHLIDLVFFLIGNPIEFNTKYSGNSFRNFKFNGNGVTDKNCDFVFSSDWLAPGSWSIDISTNNYRLILCPLEKLTIYKYKLTSHHYQPGLQRHAISRKYVDSIKLNKQNVDFKPGVYKMLESLTNNELTNFGNIEQFKYRLDFINSFAVNI